MRKAKLLWAVIALSAVARTTSAAVTYPAGTTFEQMWTTPPKVTSERAIEILTRRLLTTQAEGEEVDLDSEEVEAFKYLFDAAQATVEEDAEGRRYVFELAPETMTAAQTQFHDGLALALADALGMQGAASWVNCIGYRYFIYLKIVIRFTSQVDIWGIAAFGVNYHYGLNNSDLIYGIYPFGFQVGYLAGLKCVFDAGGLPSMQEFEGCARTKQWMLQGPSALRLISRIGHVVPGVAQAGLIYAGALASGEADQFRTHQQHRPPGDATWLLGPSHTPLPSRISSFITPSGQPGTIYHYIFRMVVSWFPTIVLTSGYNNPVPFRGESYEYDGRGEGNPHSLGNFFVRHPLSRHHQPLACD